MDGFASIHQHSTRAVPYLTCTQQRYLLFVLNVNNTIKYIYEECRKHDEGIGGSVRRLQGASSPLCLLEPKITIL